MPEHTTSPSPIATEPCASAEVARLIVAALVALGIVNLDDSALTSLTALVGAALSIGFTLWARRKSTPLAQPRDENGTPLAPVVTDPPPPGT